MTSALFCPSCAGLGTLEATDLFCGAGGSSLGLEFVRCGDCGRQLIQVTQALNHWDLAVEAHNENFPHADHDLHDVEVVPATRFRRTPLLWASPDCTHHAYCRGRRSGDASAERSRMTFHDVARFTAHHRYDAVIVENVIEARLWCDTRSHPDRCNCGSHFAAWFESMLRLGYEGQIVYFNSQFALPTPQSRDRMYVLFWRQGLPRPNLDFRPVSWCSACATVVRGVQTWKPASKGSARETIFEWGRYGAQYVYTCPDCRSVVAPAVMGARTIIDWTLETTRIGDRAKPLAPKTRARIRNGLERLATTEPVTVQVGGHLYERPGYARVWSVHEPLRPVTGTSCMGLVTPAGGQEAHGRSLDEPSHTILGNDRLAVVVRAGGQNANGRSARGVGEPLQTIVGSDRQMALVIQNMEHNAARDVAEPTPPVTTGGNHMLVQVSRGAKNGRDSRSVSTLDEPTRTIAGHGELALVAFRNHGDARSIDEPAHTLTAGGHHHGLLVYNGVPGFVRSLEDAAGTITARDKQSLLVPYYRTGVAHDIGEPMGAVTSRDRQALVVTDADVDDCLFRMLQWPELLAAQQMHMRPDGSAYRLVATRRDKRGRHVGLSNELRVKMIGNAVSAPVAAMLGSAVAEILA